MLPSSEISCGNRSFRRSHIFDPWLFTTELFHPYHSSTMAARLAELGFAPDVQRTLETSGFSILSVSLIEALRRMAYSVWRWNELGWPCAWRGCFPGMRCTLSKTVSYTQLLIPKQLRAAPCRNWWQRLGWLRAATRNAQVGPGGFYQCWPTATLRFFFVGYLPSDGTHIWTSSVVFCRRAFAPGNLGAGGSDLRVKSTSRTLSLRSMMHGFFETLIAPSLVTGAACRCCPDPNDHFSRICGVDAERDDIYRRLLACRAIVTPP